MEKEEELSACCCGSLQEKATFLFFRFGLSPPLRAPLAPTGEIIVVVAQVSDRIEEAEETPMLLEEERRREDFWL